jgi:hypothetical protein
LFNEIGAQFPGVAFGREVKDIPDKSVSDLYAEARRASAAGSYTGAVLCCRKLLMHIAVSKGAKSGENFAFYVDYLANRHFVPPDSKEWIDHIRKKGNEANHEIIIMKQEDAEELIKFIELLLIFIFEFPAAIVKKTGNPSNAT